MNARLLEQLFYNNRNFEESLNYELAQIGKRAGRITFGNLMSTKDRLIANFGYVQKDLIIRAILVCLEMIDNPEKYKVPPVSEASKLEQYERLSKELLAIDPENAEGLRLRSFLAALESATEKTVIRPGK